ncbi:MAG: hypothetical protein CVU81_02740 [Euryarchaeota archaeon HGW-Euryarchaeota-1]|nr:MAG: hypothetical protein CVU81_02740 [Euryarchaeota archaeon HGW-Euryarchaeota-1]
MGTESYFDVVIVGGGPAGLECALNLGNSKLKVLLVERNKIVGDKPCGNGVGIEDLKYIPKHLLNFDFTGAKLHYNRKTYMIDSKFLATIDRKKVLNYKLDKIKKFKNISVLLETEVKEVISNNSLKLTNGKTIRFKYLVGADGANSIVRKYLNLPLKKGMIGIQYIVPGKANDFELYYDDALFGTGYVWIFPYVDSYSVGVGSEMNVISPQKLKENFFYWLKKNKIDVSKGQLQVHMINSDYRGYKFCNVFLSGCAAGLTDGLNGKGIYSAFVSGEQIAKDILGQPHENKVLRCVNKNMYKELYLSLLKHPFLRQMLNRIYFLLLSCKKIRNTIVYYI